MISPRLRSVTVGFLGWGGEKNGAAPHFSPLPSIIPNPEAERSRGHFDLLVSLRICSLNNLSFRKFISIPIFKRISPHFIFINGNLQLSTKLGYDRRVGWCSPACSRQERASVQPCAPVCLRQSRSFLPHLLAQKLSFLPHLDFLVLLGQAKRTR